MTEFGPWTLEQDGPLAVLTIAKPPLNLFDEPVFDGVIRAIDAVAESDARGLLMRADGKVWTGGVDVKMFHGLSADGGAEVWRRGFDLVQKIEDLPFPTVFAAHALCLTWGFELALACDLLVAAEGAQFGLVEIVVGLTPSMGGPQRLAEKAGPSRAKELIFTGGLYDAATMRDWGVVNKVWPDDEFEERSRKLALRLANGPTRAKRLIFSGQLFGAAEMKEWGVVSDVWADDEFEEKARKLATRIANGPTVAHAATKQIVRTQKEDGARAADAITPELSGTLFETEDLKNAVESFLAEGPGKASYAGR